MNKHFNLSLTLSLDKERATEDSPWTKDLCITVCLVMARDALAREILRCVQDDTKKVSLRRMT
jgi:hypothetical protein